MSDRDETLAALSEEIARLLRGGVDLDEAALAERFGVESVDVADCAAALRLLGSALDEDLPPELPAPELPDDYELIGEIGRGGMGVVYRARQRSLDRTVAVKVLRPGDLMFAEAIRRFEKEAKSLARLRHPHIVSVHEVGRAGGHVYFSMDLIEGGSLADRIRAGTMTPSEAVRILAQVADAISYTHSRGIVHRDLKPENILIDGKGDAYVVDFGLARDIAVRSDLTASGRILGTPAYMSPEQARGDANRIGEATDVYALGAILYECLTGRSPFKGMPLVEQIHAVIHQEPVRPAKRNPRVPKDLEAVCLKALAKETGRRYATAKALREDLIAFADGRSVRARRPSRLAPAMRFAVRHRGALATAAVAILLLAGAFELFIRPEMGRTPTSRLETADELAAEGEHAAAAVLYQGVLDALAGEVPGELQVRAHRGLARAGMHAGRELMRDGKLDEAMVRMDETLAAGDAAFGRDGWSEKGDLLWDRMICRFRSGDAAGSQGALRDLENWLRDECHQLDRRKGTFGASDPFAYAARETLRRLSTLLEDGDMETAGWVYLMVAQPSGRGAAAAWARENGAKAIPVLVGAVRTLGTVGEEEEARALASGIEYGFRSFRGTPLAPLLSEGLAGLARDESAPEGVRAMGLKLLAQLNDLPRTEIREAGRVPPLPRFSRGFLEETLSLWREVRDMAPIEGFRRRVEAAVEATERPWLRSHTGRKDIDPEWWEENDDRDPRHWLAENYGLAPNAGLHDVFRVFEHAAQEDRFALHTLLSLSSRPNSRLPAWPCGLPEPTGLTAAWRRAVLAPEDRRPRLVRIARFDASDGRPDPVIVWEETIPVRIGEGVPFKKEWTAPPRWSVTLRVPGLGSRPPGGPRGRGFVSTGVALDWVGEDLHAAYGGVRKEFRSVGGGTTFSWSVGGGNGQPAAILSGPTGMPNEFLGGRDGRVVSEFEVAVVEGPGADPRPWTLADWRRKMVENLEFLAAEAEKSESADVGFGDAFHGRFYRSTWMLAPVAAHLGPPPEAMEPMRRLVAARRNRQRNEEDTWIPARLLAGDTEVLEDPDRIAAAVESANFENGYWVRLLLGTDQPAIREHALSVIQGWGKFPLGLQATLEEAIDAGRLDAPKWLREQVSGGARRYELARMDGALGLLILGGIAGLVGLLLVPFALRGSRRCATLLVAIGLVWCAMDVHLGPTDLQPDVVGFALAGLGAVLLSRGIPKRLARVTPVAFLLAAAAEGAAAAGISPAVSVGLAGLFAAAGVFALPWLAARRIVRPVFWVCYGVPVALTWITLVWVLVRGESITLKGDWLQFGIFACAAGAIWAVASLIVAGFRSPGEA